MADLCSLVGKLVGAALRMLVETCLACACVIWDRMTCESVSVVTCLWLVLGGAYRGSITCMPIGFASGRS
eukprot:4718220-Amphidinium_carterae.1